MNKPAPLTDTWLRVLGVTGNASASDWPRAAIGILDSLDLPIVVVGLDVTVACFNRAAADILQLAPSHVGQSLSALTAVPDLDKLCARVIADHSPYRREVSHEGKWFVLRIAPYSHDGQNIGGAILTLTNVTAFRASIDQSIYEREYAKMILNTVVEPLVVLDADLRVQTANRAFYKMFHVARDEAQGVALSDLRQHVWDDPALWVRLRETLSENKEVSALEIEHHFPTIGRRTLLLDARQLSWEAHPRQLMLLAFRDITERKQAEEQLATATEALLESDRKKDQFLAMLAHELRNPLGPVRNAVHYLKVRQFLDPQFIRPVEMIERQVTHMARLIDDLLDVNRITRGLLELRREPLDFSEIAAAVVDSWRDEVELHGQTLSAEFPKEPLPLHADRHRLVQIFSNVISNAVKYTPPEGRIEFSARHDGGMLEVLVRDTGSGIPPEKLSDIFGLFEQVDQSLERHGGLGIGLALSRNLVEMHDGTIEARSDGAGRGTTIVVRLPIAVAPAATPRVAVVQSGKAASRRILVADDNIDAAESLALLLETAGHNVRHVNDGQAAVDSATEFLPEVALIDIGMPKMNGYEVARRIRESDWGKSIHLVAFTGWGQEKDRLLAIEAGFNAHMVKPVSPDMIRQLLAELGESSLPEPQPGN